MTATLEATRPDHAPEARVVVSARDLARRYG